MLFGILAASYSFFIRFFLNNYYHFENSQWSVEEIRSSISVAVNYGSLIYIGMYLVISFLNIPAVIFFTRAFAQNKRQECEKILSFTLFLGIILITFFTSLLYASTNSIIKVFGNGITKKSNPDLAHLTRKMAHALFYCTILIFTPLFIFELFSNMMIAEGRNITVLLINLFDFCCQPLFFFIFIKYIDLGLVYSIMVIPLADIGVFFISLIPIF